jgi:hypothetical protein
LPEDERNLFIIGPLARGGGGHNLAWSWQFVANAWQMVDTAIEVCDGRASDIEADLDYWVDHLGYFCPWDGYVKAEVQDN